MIFLQKIVVSTTKHGQFYSQNCNDFHVSKGLGYGRRRKSAMMHKFELKTAN